MATGSSHPQHPPHSGVLRGTVGPALAGRHHGIGAGGSGGASGFAPRSTTPGSSFGGSSRPSNQPTDNIANGPSRTMPPYPQRYTSPQPADRAGRPPSPSKRSGPQKYPAPDQRERWASIGQMQNPIHPQGQMPPPFDARYAGNADQQYSTYGHERGGGYLADEAHHDPQLEPGSGFRDMPYGGYDQGFGNAAHSQMPPGSMSPRSLMQFHQQQQQRIQQQQQHYRQSQPQPPLPSQHQQQASHSMPTPATNLGSGLMSNSGQPAEEITTIFIVGFPDDMTEREFSNMFLFARGFEASTLKVPGGGPLPTPGGDGSRSGGRGDGSGGPGGPYQAVMPGANHFDLASNGGWDEHSLNLALGRQTNDPSFGMNALNLGDNGGRGGGPPNAAGAGKIKQIIGFAKFRSRGEALEARDALNGKKIDSERGCVLKTEMAKKNLHTKQRPVLSGIGQGPLGPGDGGNSSYGAEGPRSAGASVSSAYPSSFASNGGQGSFDAFARAGGPPSSTLSALSGMISPQGQNDPFGADFLRGTAPGSGMSANARSGSSGDSGSTGPKGSGGDGAKWSSMGPLDYFGPPTEVESQPQAMQPTRQRQATLESKAGGTPAVNIRPHSQSQSSVNPGLGSGSSVPRGPDWSAIGSPPGGGGGGLFASARPFASSKDRPSVSSTAAPFVPQMTSASSAKSQPSEEDFGQGESTMSSTTKESEREGETTSSKGTTASETPTVAASSTSRSPRGPGNASSAFAARFGSLRLDSPNTITNPTSPPRTEDCNDGAQSTSSKQVEEQSTRSTVAPDASNTTSPASRASKSPTMPDLPTSPTSRSFSIDQNPPGNTLFVGNLPASVTPSLSASLEKQLRARFSSRSGYRQLSYRLKNNGPMCFVEFDNVQNAARALSEVNGDTMDGMVKNGGLRLSFSKNPLFRKDSHSTGSSSTNSTSPHSPTEQTPVGQGLSSLGKAGESLRDDPLDSANNLEDLSYSQGFSAGSSHGRLHGLFEGRQLGREKGFEIWDEVGFYQGTAKFWKGVLMTSGDKATRKVAKQLGHIDALERLISAFPMKNKSGDALPSALPGSLDTVDEGDANDEAGAEDETDTADATDEQLAQMDMATLLERIRARYKLMCASLGVPAKGTAEEASHSASAAPSKTTATIAGRTVDTTQLRF